MSCSKTLDFAVATGAHLSFYWTMDEAGAADKLDSTVHLAWPLEHGALAIAGLFSNGTHFTPATVLNQSPGLLYSGAAITINQAVSNGISVWFWIKIISFGAVSSNGHFDLDTSDPLHTNRFRILWDFTSALTGSIEVGHTNDTDDVFADTPNLTWGLNTWHMVAATFDKVAHTLNLYIDGALSISTADAFVYPDLTNTTMFIEDQSPMASVGESAVVDELGLCLNGALTPDQVTSLWNAGVGETWPNITPIVPYP